MVKKRIRIGSAEDNDYVVTGEDVAPYHISLVQDNAYSCRVVGQQSNATYVNGERLEDDKILYGGEELKVGDIVIPWNEWFTLDQYARLYGNAISGWLIVFCVLLGLGILPWVSACVDTPPDTFVVPMIITLCYCFVAIYTIYSLIEKKPNAIFLSRWIVIFWTCDCLFSGNIIFILFSLIFNGLWLVYIAKSKQIEVLFPEEERKVNWYDWLAVAPLILVITSWTIGWIVSIIL